MPDLQILGWLVVEDTKSGVVEVLNLERVLDLDAGKNKFGRVIVEVWTDGVQISTIELADWGEFEKLITLLPGAKELGWIYIVDGRVQNWKGRLRILQNAEEGKSDAV